MKLPIIKTLNHPEIITATRDLPTRGMLKITDNKLVYLDIDDEYIHRLFPLIQDPLVQKPNYFAKGSAGAHITVSYPEENKIIDNGEMNQEYNFKILKAVTAKIGAKTYYVLLVHSPALLALRHRYHLPDELNFKGYLIGFHITFGGLVSTL